METKGSNGNILQDGDAVVVIKDLKVKRFPGEIKRGTLVKNIRLTDDPGEIEGKVESSVMVLLKTVFVKKR
ncbi:alkylphosphonate utilization protein [Nitrosomonas communis]|uniref:Phosphonoacetate hydrolase n=1 Tax=Nitrosomonas communis TaxID=44574 RepID=A0A1I4KID6_9PROT|nr:alkylphosphonate utilization protein [Nitrosomonas communis]SFL78389.1 phosphonoacetate hydrolase [Nitrosomonas communis]